MSIFQCGSVPKVIRIDLYYPEILLTEHPKRSCLKFPEDKMNYNFKKKVNANMSNKMTVISLENTKRGDWQTRTPGHTL
jgi:hypothetical protein